MQGIAFYLFIFLKILKPSLLFGKKYCSRKTRICFQCQDNFLCLCWDIKTMPARFLSLIWHVNCGCQIFPESQTTCKLACQWNGWTFILLSFSDQTHQIRAELMWLRGMRSFDHRRNAIIAVVGRRSPHIGGVLSLVCLRYWKIGGWWGGDFKP